jgi:hypothetical protein
MSHELDNKAGAAPHGELKPEWIRPKDVPRFFALGRTKIYELLAEGKVRSVSLKKRGQKHGTRLISYDSLSAYLESLATGGEP